MNKGRRIVFIFMKPAHIEIRLKSTKGIKGFGKFFVHPEMRIEGQHVTQRWAIGWVFRVDAFEEFESFFMAVQQEHSTKSLLVPPVPKLQILSELQPMAGVTQ